MAERIVVLLAIYNPNVEWLAEQLASIDRQDYPNVEVLALDDGSDKVEEQTIRETLRHCLKRVPYRYRKNPENVGSNWTFEQLTMEAEGDLVAYCDQDDIWEAEKLSACLRRMKETGAGLVCSDVRFIGADGGELLWKTEVGRLADWVEREGRGREYAPQHQSSALRSDPPLWQRLVFRNYAPGCSMLVEASLAKAALPFPKTMYHDHYLALWAAIHGPVAVCREKLVRRRLHGENQTTFLGTVWTKEDYIAERVEKTYEILDELQTRLEPEESCRDYLAAAREWSLARRSYAAGGGIRELRKLLRGAAWNPRTTIFEAVSLPLPERWWRMGLHVLHRHGR